MAVVYSDSDISQLVAERKPLPQDWRARLRLRTKLGHEESFLDCTGQLGSQFRLILRQSSLNVLDFSAILGVYVPQSNRLFRLRRYNGRSHEHTNNVEGETFYGYHIHLATERYQEMGAREDAYAEATERYDDLDGALQCLLDDAGFDVPPGPQLKMKVG